MVLAGRASRWGGITGDITDIDVTTEELDQTTNVKTELLPAFFRRRCCTPYHAKYVLFSLFRGASFNDGSRRSYQQIKTGICYPRSPRLHLHEALREVLAVYGARPDSLEPLSGRQPLASLCKTFLSML